MSENYQPNNLLDRLSKPSTLQVHYDWIEHREREILSRYLLKQSGDILSVGSGWHPGRHLFPAPQFQLTAVDSDENKVTGVQHMKTADHAIVGRAGYLDMFAAQSFDVVLYRLVLHHIIYQEPLDRCFAEACRLLRPGGMLIAIEPGLWHPVGFALAVANKLQLGTLVHGTPDDIPLSPRQLCSVAQKNGFQPHLHAVTYTWRRLPSKIQLVLQAADKLGSRRHTKFFGHTLMLIAQK